jgi:hypothetical protein
MEENRQDVSGLGSAGVNGSHWRLCRLKQLPQGALFVHGAMAVGALRDRLTYHVHVLEMYRIHRVCGPRVGSLFLDLSAKDTKKLDSPARPGSSLKHSHSLRQPFRAIALSQRLDTLNTSSQKRRVKSHRRWAYAFGGCLAWGHLLGQLQQSGPVLQERREIAVCGALRATHSTTRLATFKLRIMEASGAHVSSDA